MLIGRWRAPTRSPDTINQSKSFTAIPLLDSIIFSKKGLNYKTGLAYKISHTKRVHKSYYIGGLKMGNCYKFRAYSKHKDYLANQGTYAFNSPYSRINVWKIAKGMDGSPNTITI